MHNLNAISGLFLTLGSPCDGTWGWGWEWGRHGIIGLGSEGYQSRGLESRTSLSFLDPWRWAPSIGLRWMWLPPPGLWVWHWHPLLTSTDACGLWSLWTLVGRCLQSQPSHSPSGLSNHSALPHLPLGPWKLSLNWGDQGSPNSHLHPHPQAPPWGTALLLICPVGRRAVCLVNCDAQAFPATSQDPPPALVSLKPFEVFPPASHPYLWFICTTPCPGLAGVSLISYSNHPKSMANI